MGNEPQNVEELLERWRDDRDRQDTAMEILSGQATDLSQRLTHLDGEIASVKAEAEKAAKPFYKTPASIIALCAFLLSLMTATISECRARNSEGSRRACRAFEFDRSTECHCIAVFGSSATIQRRSSNRRCDVWPSRWRGTDRCGAGLGTGQAERNARHSCSSARAALSG